MAERLHKVLARAGVASRRAAERLIAEGRVAINGAAVVAPGALADPASDAITVDGERIAPAGGERYILLHKPVGYVSTAHDERGRATVLDLVPGDERLYPAGRLDADSEGLLLLTNDGAFANQLTHPRFKVPKEYHVLVRGAMPEEALAALRAGVELAEGRTAPTEVVVLESDRQHTWLGVVLRQGWKRQVRRMLAAVGYAVERLVRVRIGRLELGSLSPGDWRELTADEAAQALVGDDGARDHRDRRAGGGRQDHGRPRAGSAPGLGAAGHRPAVPRADAARPGARRGRH